MTSYKLLSLFESLVFGVNILLLGILVVFSILVYRDVLHFFEDGSWAIGQYPYWIFGCFPWGTCR